ncbi:hypothetical protein Ccrd_015489 [Cynara cardunculus var. scolymus]|uniref:NAD(P)-binding domain-containing protein n=1 Tax=Cynara cardunculus var. scolymus TaxID=59895 RepID=A0A118K3L4_CYNCS|nr:hypothetical protein Ccrd_015489 [Cynara cardunculus var. scolymus]
MSASSSSLRADQSSHGFCSQSPQFLAPIATIAALFFLTTPYIVLKLLCHIARSISKENVAGKVVLIVGASSGIGELEERSLREVADAALSLGAPEAIAIPADVMIVSD